MSASVSVKLSPEQFDTIRDLIEAEMESISPLFDISNPDRPGPDEMQNLRIRYMKLDQLRASLS